jgi:hypothetical protein
MPFAHIFRAGSRFRLQIDTPGDSRERWRFMLLEYDGPVKNYVAHSAVHPSSIALPLIPDFDVPTPMPPCPSLRGQPCRDFAAYVNTLEAPPERPRHPRHPHRRRDHDGEGDERVDRRPEWSRKGDGTDENTYRRREWSIHDRMRWRWPED